MSRRQFGVLLASLASASFAGLSTLRSEALAESFSSSEPSASAAVHTLYDEAVARVLPPEGFQSRIALQDSVLKLIEHGVIDRSKFLAAHQNRKEELRSNATDLLGWTSAHSSEDAKTILNAHEHHNGGLRPELQYLLRWPSHEPILLTRGSANFYLNLLWPLGLSNFMSSNEESPLNGESLPNFASTGGWILGKEENGSAYFNKFRIVELTAEQEALVSRVARSTYRPCCDNSTFFQDCNHGSALLGVLELGASQGLNEAELYSEAMAFNSFWFPDQYIQTALYFTVVEGLDWTEIDAAIVMGFNYSALSSWQRNVQARLATLPNLIPEQLGGANCGV